MLKVWCPGRKTGPDVRALHEAPLFSKSFFHNTMKYSNRMPCKWPRIPFPLQNMQLPLAHLCSILRSFDHDEKGRLTKIVLRYRLQSIGLLICTLIYENQGLENSGVCFMSSSSSLCSSSFTFQSSKFGSSSISNRLA